VNWIIYFVYSLCFLVLNALKGRSNVRSFGEVADLFKHGPSGTTPLAESCRKAFSKLSNKPLLVLMATDGEETKKEYLVYICFIYIYIYIYIYFLEYLGVPNDLNGFKKELSGRDANRIFVSILAW
jgi:hypothetical protein